MGISDALFVFASGASASVYSSLAYVPAAAGFYFALRCLRFPDLTVEGAFALGQVFAALSIADGHDPILGLFLGTVGGAFCGLATALWHVKLRVPTFVSGIITTFAVQSLNFKLLRVGFPEAAARRGAEPTEVSLDSSGILESARSLDLSGTGRIFELQPTQLLILFLVVIGAIIASYIILRSSLGREIRAFGVHRETGGVYHAHPRRYLFLGLALANALVGFGGALAAQSYRMATISLGTELLIPLLAAVVLGEFVVDFLNPFQWRRHSKHQNLPLLSRPLSLAFAPALGFMGYNAIFLLIAAVVLPNIGEEVSSYHKYWITAAVILLVLYLRRVLPTGERPHPEDVI